MQARRSMVCALVLLFGSHALAGCRSCGRSEERRTTERKAPSEPAGCGSAGDCADDNPCTEQDCVDFKCVATPVAEGKNCDNGDVCDGIEHCDQEGQCVAGTPPVVDDGNACTQDACDPVRGVTHQPVPVDDGNACTIDACDPRSGQVTHAAVDAGDGDDCTTDSCDPRLGVRHERQSPSYTCNPTCPEGFHAASRSPSQECATTGLRAFCTPDCGASFYACDAACPKGYRAVSKTTNTQCGSAESAYTFCQKS